jgi:hypothetical protein
MQQEAERASAGGTGTLADLQAALAHFTEQFTAELRKRVGWVENETAMRREGEAR